LITVRRRRTLPTEECPIEPIRILLVDLPQLARTMIEAALAKPDLAIVGKAASEREMLNAARATRPNFVIVGVDGPELSQSCRHLLTELPGTRVFGIDAESGEAHLYELSAVRMEEISPDELVEAIRERARHPLEGVQSSG
jgi:DNA-binding NarL/FixJ family response regulator